MRQRGLTLVELLLSSTIAVVVGGLLLSMVVSSSNVYYKEGAKVNLGLDANDALAQIRKTIKQASSISAAYIDGAKTYTSGETELVLKVPSLDSEGNIILGVFDDFVFFQDQSKLRLKTFPNILSSRKAQDQIFSTSVEKVLFQYFNSENPPVGVLPIKATKVKVSLALKEKSGSGFETSDATSEANLQND